MRFRNIIRFAFALIFLCGGFLFSVSAQDSYGKKSEMKAFRAEFLAQFDEGTRKILQLVDAMPQDKYTWRPQEGVRSVSEVYMHISNTNMFFGSLTPILRVAL